MGYSFKELPSSEALKTRLKNGNMRTVFADFAKHILVKSVLYKKKP